MLLKHIRRVHRGLDEEAIQSLANNGEIQNQSASVNAESGAPIKVEPGDLDGTEIWNVNTAINPNISPMKSETVSEMGPPIDNESLISQSGALYGYFQSKHSKVNPDMIPMNPDDDGDAEHVKIKREKDYARNWKCALCPLDYISKRLLINHIKLHVNGRGLECPYCSALLPRPCDRNRHIRTYHSHLKDNVEVSSPT